MPLRTNYIKANIDYMQNRKCMLIGDRNEIISKCSKLAQNEYKSRHDWVRKVIYWELCKILKFDHADKWCKHKVDTVLENEIKFSRKANGLPNSKRPDFVLIKKDHVI